MMKHSLGRGLARTVYQLQRRYSTYALNRAFERDFSGQKPECGCKALSRRKKLPWNDVAHSGFPPVVQRRQLNIFSIFSQEARAEEAERLKDELNRGYFDDFKELKKTGGKVTGAGLDVIPAARAVSFPFLTVRTKDGATLGIPCNDTLPSDHHGQPASPTAETPLVTAVCLAFRASGQSMVESWSTPFAEKFAGTPGIRLYEVSMVESSVLSSRPIQSLILPFMKAPPSPTQPQESTPSPIPKILVYSFGDTYHFRKVLSIHNRLTGYIFLLDKEGRVRWQASGRASDEEMERLVAATETLLKGEVRT